MVKLLKMLIESEMSLLVSISFLSQLSYLIIIRMLSEFQFTQVHLCCMEVSSEMTRASAFVKVLMMLSCKDVVCSVSVHGLNN